MRSITALCAGERVRLRKKRDAEREGSPLFEPLTDTDDEQAAAAPAETEELGEPEGALLCALPAPLSLCFLAGRPAEPSAVHAWASLQLRQQDALTGRPPLGLPQPRPSLPCPLQKELKTEGASQLHMPTSKELKASSLKACA